MTNELLRELMRAMHERFDRLDRRQDEHFAYLREVADQTPPLVRAPERRPCT